MPLARQLRSMGTMRRLRIVARFPTLSTGLVLALASAGPSRAEDAADLILAGGLFYPVSSPGAVSGSLAIRDGRIVYLGPAAGVEALRGPDTEVVELDGRAATPGWIDAHSHLAGLGAALEAVDLVGAPNYEEVVARVASAAAQLPPGSWVSGQGWDQNDWPERAFPHHAALSAAVPQHPVWLDRIDGHAALVNAAAVVRLGIDERIADPPGGRFLRDAGGVPTGVLIDAAMTAVADRLPEVSAADRERRLRAAAAHCLALGLTTVTDMGVGNSEVAAYRALAQAGALPLRAALFLDGSDESLLGPWFSRGPETDAGRDRLLVRGVKLFADGALGSRGAALLEPYDDDPGNLGLVQMPGEALLAVVERARMAGFQVGIHAIGDRGNLIALDALEVAGGGPRPDLRWRIEHAQVLRLADIERLARLGIIASMQPTHATSDGPWAEARVGPRRILGAYAWRRVLAAGGRLALGSDFPVESANPLLGLFAAVTRRDLSGALPAAGWHPEERLSREEALRGFTLDAAYSLFLDDAVGSLEVGKRADVVVFDRDPMQVPVEEIPNLKIDLTLVDGEIVFARHADA